jgi:hypothetical protein
MRDVCSWPKADVRELPFDVCFRGKGRHHNGRVSLPRRGAALASVAPDHAGNLRAAADGLNRTLVIGLCGAPDQPNQVTAGLSKTITLETKALTFRVCVRPQPEASAQKSSFV